MMTPTEETKPATAKEATSYRLTKTTKQRIAGLAEELGTTQSFVIELAVSDFARRNGEPEPPTNSEGPWHCLLCGEKIDTTRPARYCPRPKACRELAFQARERRKAGKNRQRDTLLRPSRRQQPLPPADS